MILMHDTSSHLTVQLYEVSYKFINRINGCQLTERTLIVPYNCMKFHINRINGCQLSERTQNSIANDQSEVTPKISKVELWSLCMTHHLIALYNCMKFR